VGWAEGPFFVCEGFPGAMESGDVLHEVIEPVVSQMGCELWGIEHVVHGRRSRLTVFIEHEDGINVDACARVSRQLSRVLDVEDPVPGEYTLEVSSPGLDRRLFKRSQFEAYAGSQIRINLKRNWEGRRKFKGLLCGVEDDDIVVRSGDQEYLFPISEIEHARIVPAV
jgi:ribosome maturation factor RimP